MKSILIAVLIALPVFANQAHPYEFEIEPGCVWFGNTGSCIIINRLNSKISCKISITGKTLRGFTIGNVRQVVIPPKGIDSSIRVYAASIDEFVNVSALAECIPM